MLEVRISEEAKAAVLARGASEGQVQPGLVLRRVGPYGEVKRSTLGAAEWAIDRPLPLRAEVKDLAGRVLDPSFVGFAKGIPVVLLLHARPEEKAIEITLLSGELHAEPTDA